jgi:hypothetical protein
MAHVALSAPGERRLTDTPITLFLIGDQEEPEWRQRLEAACDLSSLQFNVGWAQMAKYAQYLFNLQHNTDHTVIEQRVCLDMYGEQAIRTSLALERIGCKIHILRQGKFGI